MNQAHWDRAKKQFGLVMALMIVTSWNMTALSISPDLNLPESTWITVDNQVLHCLDFDPGPGKTRAVVLMIHGMGGYSAESLSWGRLLRDQGIRMLAPDLPGCGISPSFLVNPGMAGYAALVGETIIWAADLASSLQSGSTPCPLFLSSHSTGCQMVLLNCIDWTKGIYGPPQGDSPLAKAWQSVQGLFLLAPNGMKGEEGPLLSLRARWIMDSARSLMNPGTYSLLMDMQVHYDPKRVDPAISRWGVASLMSPGAWDGMVDYVMDVLAYDPLDGRLDAVKLPVTILWGKQDKVLNFSNSSRFTAEMPQARLVALDHCGHGIHHELASVCRDELMDFMGLKALSTQVLPQ